jgi:hypothetical protein
MGLSVGQQYSLYYVDPLTGNRDWSCIFFIDIFPLSGKIKSIMYMDYEKNGKLSLHWLLC